MIPKVPPDEKYEITNLGTGFWRLVLHFGYMEYPHVVDAIGYVVRTKRLPVDLQEITYYVGHEKLKTATSAYMGKTAERIFGYLQRNAVEVESTFGLPPRQVVEIGTQIDL